MTRYRAGCAATAPWRGRRDQGAGAAAALSRWASPTAVTVLAADGGHVRTPPRRSIANAVDVAHPAIRRAPAESLARRQRPRRSARHRRRAGSREDAVRRALEAARRGARCVDAGLVGAALLALQGRWRASGTSPRALRRPRSSSGEHRPPRAGRAARAPRHDPLRSPA
jgi:hypothetical protein